MNIRHLPISLEQSAPVCIPARTRFVSEDKWRLHTLYVHWAFYLDRTKSFWISSKFFVSYAEYLRDHPVTTQRLSKWITDCITLCYAAKGATFSDRLMAHSARAQSISAAFMVHVPVTDICRTAMWSAIHIFVRHYALSAQFCLQSWIIMKLLINVFVYTL